LPTLYLDRIEGSQLVRDQQGIASATRVAIVDGVDIDPNADNTHSDPFILVRALATAGLPQTLSSHPSDPSCKLVRHIVRGMANQQCRIDCMYERPSYGGTVPVGTWVLQTDTVARPMAVQRNPRTLDPIRVKYKPPNATSNLTVEKTATVVVDIPICRLVARGQFYGLAFGKNWRSAVGSVNQGAFQGLAQGFWLFDEMKDEPTQINTGDTTQSLYTYSIVLSTQINFSWAYYAFYRLPSGDFVKIDPTNMAQVRAKVYDGTDLVTDFGVTRIEPYPMVNYTALFGIPAV
jgi:hypothetical protein